MASNNHSATEKLTKRDPRLGVAGAAVLLIAASNSAQAATQLQDITCAETSTAAVARQPWGTGRSPYGLPYESWTSDDFAKLKAKIRDCGGDDAYVGYQEQLQERTRPSESALLRKGFEAELTTISNDPTEALQQLGDLSQRATASSMDRGDKAAMSAIVDNRRRGLLIRKAGQDRAQAAANAEPRLRALIADVNATPATIAGRSKLEKLYSGNNYRLPELSFEQQNRYWSAIGLRLAQIDQGISVQQCEPLTTKMGLPLAMQRYEIVEQLGISMSDVVCQSYVATGHGEFRPIGSTSAGLYSVRSGKTILIFQLGRYVRETSAFFPPSAPVQRGTPAFRFEGIRDGTGTTPVARGFLTNLLAQYAGPWTEFARDPQGSKD